MSFCLKAWKLSHLFSKVLGITKMRVFELSYRLSFHFSRSDSDLRGATRTICCSLTGRNRACACMREQNQTYQNYFWLLVAGCRLYTTLIFPFPLSSKKRKKKKKKLKWKSHKTIPPNNSSRLSVRFKALILYLHRKEDIELLTLIARGQGGSVKHQWTDRISLNTDCIPVVLLLEGCICTTRITAADPRSSQKKPVPGQNLTSCSPASASDDSLKTWG